MLVCLRRITPLVACLFACAHLQAEVLVRWDRNDVPSRDSLGVAALVIPATNASAVRTAIAHGFGVYLEVEASTLGRFAVPTVRLAGVVVKGQASPEQLSQLRKRLEASGARLLLLDERGKWPRIRSNVVTRRNDVLQVASRTAQPWLEHNAALVRIAHLRDAEPPLLLSYRWEPSTVTEADEGPALEDYLVAIAEAGSFGGDLLLPLHERLQRSLLLGKPLARGWWTEIRRYIEFYAWNLPARYKSIANIGVLTSEPMRGLEVMKLLTRHNLPFEVIAPERLGSANLSSLKMLVVLETPQPSHLGTLADFVRKGGLMVVAADDSSFPWRTEAPVTKTGDRASYQFGEGRVLEVLKPIADPNRFALEVWDLLGRERRIIDVWNGITVLTTPYEEPDGSTVLITAVNYAHDGESVQLRIAGTYSLVQYESPEHEATLLPYTHRNGYTEFVMPALRVGGRIFLSRQAGLN
jgi:hypothetical protein